MIGTILGLLLGSSALTVHAAPLFDATQQARPEMFEVKRYKGGSMRCRFRDLPDLQLSQQADGKATGLYEAFHSSVDGGVRLNIWLKRDANRRVEVAVSNIEIEHRLFDRSQQLGNASVRIDGRPVATTHSYWGSSSANGATRYFLGVPFRQNGEASLLGMDRGERLQVTTTYSNGQRMNEIEISVWRVRRILPLLNAADWRCA